MLMKSLGAASAKNDEVKTSKSESLVERIAIRLNDYQHRKLIINVCAEKVSKEHKKLILDSVINGKSYDQLSSKDVLPISKREFYNMRRKFFFELDKERM